MWHISSFCFIQFRKCLGRCGCAVLDRGNDIIFAIGALYFTQ